MLWCGGEASGGGWILVMFVWSATGTRCTSVDEPPPKRLVEVEGLWDLGVSFGQRGSVPVAKASMGIFFLLDGFVEEFTLTVDDCCMELGFDGCRRGLIPSHGVQWGGAVWSYGCKLCPNGGRCR